MKPIRKTDNEDDRLNTTPLTIACVVLFAIFGSAGPAYAQTAYISDNLTVPLRSGPSNANRILHRGLPSGTELEILARDEDSGFVQIRTTRGTEGWLPEQYLLEEPIARDRLVIANRRIAELSGTVEQQRAQLGNLNRDKGQADQSNVSLQRQVKTLERELADIKQISAGAIEQNESNERLNVLNERLRIEVDDMVGEVSNLENNVQQRWLMIGGGLVFVGLLLGVIIKSRPRRSAWN